MKQFKSFLLGITILASAAAVQAQTLTLDQIIAKHLQAVGGADKIAQLKSMYTEGTLQMMGTEAPNITYVQNGKGYRNETEFNGQKIIRVLTDAGGWQVNPLAGASTPQPLSDEEYKMNKEQLTIGDPFVGYKEKGSTAELVGKENGAYKIKMKSKDNTETTFFVDSATYHVTKTVTNGSFQGQTVEVSTAMSDYQKTDVGYVIPHNITIDMGGFAFTLLIKKVEMNKPIDPKLFEMPK